MGLRFSQQGGCDREARTIGIAMHNRDDVQHVIIVPCYGHSNLVRDTIESALNQDCPSPVPVVFVNDGCKAVETDFDGRLYSQLYPGRFFYVRNRNRGLGGARNAAIEFSLKNFKSVRYFFFLDSDNKLMPGFLSRSLTSINENEDADVLFFSMPNLGGKWHFDNSGSYSFSEHLSQNPIDAGSWVKADVFRRGLRYYTNKALGFEDWQLSLSIGGAGGKLMHIDNPGFLYRRRPESMVTETNASGVDSSIRQELKQYIKHDIVLRDEHMNIPRYAMWDIYSDSVRYFSDPRQADASTGLVRQDAIVDLLSSALELRRAHSPAYHIFGSPRFLRTLTDSKLDYAMLLAAERRIERGDIFAVYGRSGAGREGVVGFEKISIEDIDRLGVDFLVLSKKFLQDCALHLDKRRWLVDLLERGLIDNADMLDFCLLRDAAVQSEVAHRESMMAFHRLLASIFGEICEVWDVEPVKRRFDFKDVFIFNRNDSQKAVRNALGYGPVIPRFKSERNLEKNIVIALPFIDYGGVEKIALNTAQVLKEAGHYITLLLTQKTTAHIPRSFHDAIDELVFLEDGWAGSWNPTPEYFGAVFSPFLDHGNSANLLGVLSGADVVFNFHAGELHGVMRQMRQAGAVTIAALQVIDVDRFGNLTGYPHQTVGFEHVYDKIIAPSMNLIDWCCSHGIPREKMRLIPNGPGVPIAPVDAKGAMRARRERPEGSPLRALFMGRFDYQKGIDVLLAVISKTSRQQNIVWRVIGSSVLDDGSVQKMLSENGIKIEAPRRTKEDLHEALAECDCLVLPSRYEGVPLTIIEAMTMGCVVVATDVGGTREFVNSGSDSFLYPFDHNLAGNIAQTLETLSRDDELRLSIGEKANRTASRYAWRKSSDLICDLLEKA